MSIEKGHLKMLKFLVSDLKIDAGRRIELQGGKTTTALLLAISEEAKRWVT
jgi:hypothetical protein